MCRFVPTPCLFPGDADRSGDNILKELAGPAPKAPADIFPVPLPAYLFHWRNKHVPDALAGFVEKVHASFNGF
jgi:hypothetical protein